jgi:hypothetical protein
MKKFWKMVFPDFKIRTNLKNIDNAFRKTKSGPEVKVEKNRARKERHRVGKVKLLLLSLTLKAPCFCNLTTKGPKDEVNKTIRPDIGKKIDF